MCGKEESQRSPAVTEEQLVWGRKGKDISRVIEINVEFQSGPLQRRTGQTWADPRLGEDCLHGVSVFGAIDKLGCGEV